MAGKNDTGLFGWFIDFAGRQKKVIPVEMNEAQLVTVGIPFNISIFGGYLGIPSGFSAVLTAPDGTQTALSKGGLLKGYLAGRYTLQYVDLRQRQTPLPRVKSCTRDAWDVSLDIDLVWKVKDPVEIVRTVYPLYVLNSVCAGGLANFLQTIQHDGLVSAPGAEPIPDQTIANVIRERVKRSPSCQGFELVDIVVRQRLGDRRRNEAILKSIVEKTEIEQQGMLKVERTLQDAKALIAQAGLTGQQIALAEKEIELKRYTTLQEASLETDEARVLNDARLLEIRLEQMRREQEFRQQQVMAAIEVQRSAFHDIASAIIQTQMAPGLNRGLDGQGISLLAQALETLSHSLPNLPSTPVPVASLPPMAAHTETDLQSRLEHELVEVLKVKGVGGVLPLKPAGEGGWKVNVLYRKVAIELTCGPDYPENGPRNVEMKQGEAVLPDPALVWSTGLSLRDALLQCVVQVDARARGFIEKPGGNGSKTSQTFIQ